jgi:hypothetical protein
MQSLKNGFRLLLLFSFSLLLWFIPTKSTAQLGMVYFDPHVACASILDTFQVDIAVDSNFHNIHCFRVKIAFDRDFLSIDTIFEGPLLKNSGSTFFYYKDTAGVYDIFNCIYDPTEGYSNGPGVLASIQFIAGNNFGVGLLEFTYAIFQDTTLESISHAYSDSYVMLCGPEGCRFGDVNDDGILDVGDVVYLINYLYRNGPEPMPFSVIGDVTCDLIVDAGDVVYLINYLFRNGPEPCNPCGS